MATPEGIIKSDILGFLRGLDNCEVFPITTGGIYDKAKGRFRPHPGRIGTPDILVCLKGRFIGIEVKSPTGRVSPKQAEVIAAINDSGGFAIVARSVFECREILRQEGLV